MSNCTHRPVACQIDSIRRCFVQKSSLPFANVLPAEVLVPIFEKAGVVWRDCVYTPWVTLWMFLSQVLDADHSCRQAVARLLAYRAAQSLPPCSARTGSYCKARRRLPEGCLKELVRHTGRHLNGLAQAWHWLGRCVKVGDGTTLFMADTPANQQAYPQPDGQEPGLGFPIVRLMAIFCLSTGVALEAAFGRYRGKGTGEMALFRSIWDALEDGDVFLGDRHFCSYFEIALLQQRGIDVVLRRHQSRKTDFRRGKRLGHRDHEITWKKPQCPDWLNLKTYDSLPEMLRVRELEFQVKQPGFRTEKVVVITTLLDSDVVSKEELAKLYRARWQAELYLRSIKTVMQMDMLRCKSPAMVRKEIWTHFLAYNLIRAMIAQAADRCGLEPRQISFKGTVQTLNAFAPYLLWADTAALREWYDRLLLAIASHRVGNRPDRSEPRAIKRRKRNYPLLTEPRNRAKSRLLQKR